MLAFALAAWAASLQALVRASKSNAPICCDELGTGHRCCKLLHTTQCQSYQGRNSARLLAARELGGVLILLYVRPSSSQGYGPRFRCLNPTHALAVGERGEGGGSRFYVSRVRLRLV